MLQAIKLKSNANQSRALLSQYSKRNYSFLDYFTKKQENKTTVTKETTKDLLSALTKNDTGSQEAVNKESATKTLNFETTAVIGDSKLYEERLNSLKAHRFSQLKVNKWNKIDESEVGAFTKEDILNLIAKYNIKQDEISKPFADYKTKFLFTKDLQKLSGRSLSDFNLSLFTSPEEFLQFYQKIYLSGSFDKYDETKPLAIYLKVGEDSKKLENEIFLDLKDAGKEYKELVSTITERTKVFSPKDNNVKIKNTRSRQEQESLKEIIKEEAEYLNLK
ncbi:hypothetical protein FOG51_00540 [Hanseniaspora uvarum]|nr:hypothetical protein FOG51_00540 [Hanseniaspora uvarum]KAF0275336.1 hypothetical protein FOG50_03819 [Hanseniaspora uvarum]GMM40167.1 hypothetical protein DAHU10_010680 [Hanseniaspora uvarum]